MSSDNTYILGHTATEMVRLTEQDRLITLGMDGLLPELSDLAGIKRVLDVACGPGGWALDLAQKYQHLQVLGIDVDGGMIDYATAQAKAGGLDNATFRVMNALEPLDFPDNTFDLVNARFLAGFVPQNRWSQVIMELRRILRPGRIIRWTEQEWTGTSSSFEQAEAYTFQAMRRTGQLLAADERNVGITPLMRRFLSDAGFRNVREVAHALDFSAGTAVQRAYAQDLWMATVLLQPFHLALGVATQQELDALQQRVQEESLADDFYAIWFLLTALGTKP
jgi:ubiquinone/menaquinone biosynthesis C-methylase UbiE